MEMSRLKMQELELKEYQERMDEVQEYYDPLAFDMLD
jgi:hypothetical protein